MRSTQEPRSSSSCSACKFLKRRCIPNCLFKPYFRSDEPKRFAEVHKVFGASNVSKILNEVAEEQREETVNTLVFEAEARLRDPVYGCIGEIAALHSKMVLLQHHLAIARARLACCVVKTPPFLAFDDHLNMVPFSDIAPPFYAGFAENFDQNSLDSDQCVGLMNGYSRFPFP